MNKLIAILALTAFCQSALAGSVRIYNNDSSTHVIKLKCNGSSKSLQISRSSTSTYTFSSSANQCEIVGGSVNFPTQTLENGQAWKLKNNSASKM